LSWGKKKNPKRDQEMASANQIGRGKVISKLTLLRQWGKGKDIIKKSKREVGKREGENLTSFFPP